MRKLLFAITILLHCISLAQPLMAKIDGSSSSILFKFHKQKTITHIARAEEIVKSLKESHRINILFVDIRSKQEFDRCRIEGSINMPLYSIKTKGFLKTRPVVIVANGQNLASPLQECVRLKKRGFKDIRVLYGGIQAWVNAGGPVGGERSLCRLKRPLSPIELYEERELTDWLVIDLVGKGEGFKKLFPGWKVISLPRNGNESHIVSTIKKGLSSNPNGPSPVRILVVSRGKGMDKKALSTISALDNEGYKNIFWTNVTPNDYKTFLKEQASIIKAKERMEHTGKERGGGAPCGCGGN